MAELEFKISSALKNIIGKDLITDDFIAVFELVKNAYDAHAWKVDLVFDKDKIVIKDNGKGMSLKEIKEKWLFLAYSAKTEGVEDDDISDAKFNDYRNRIGNKRFYAGAKGIGRFSSDRLGRKLKLKTRKINSSSTEELIVDWGKFEENAETEFFKIKVQHKQIPHEFEHGTIMEITGLREGWNRPKLQRLKYSLEKLINPFNSADAQGPQDFSIEMHSSSQMAADVQEALERDKVNGKVGNFIFTTLKAKTTELITVINKEWINTTLIDRGTPIYGIREVNKNYPLLEEVRYHLFFLNHAAKSNFTRQMGIQAVNFGSVFLFKNGFRVYPFGDPEDDSLGIDYRHQQGYARTLGTRDLLGKIEINTNNIDQFKEVSSRDGGLVETEGTKQLMKSFHDKSLKLLEKYVVDVQWGIGLDKKGYEKEKILLLEDKHSEDLTILEQNLGSRARLAEIIRKLADNKDVEILYYNQDLISILEDKLSEIKPEVFKDLLRIAEKTNDSKLLGELETLESKYEKLLKEKETLEIKAKEEEARRIIAEEEAQRALEESKRLEEAKIKAEIEAREQELARREEEVKRKEAEQKVLEETVRRNKAEMSLEIETQKNKYLFATRKTLGSDAEQLIHSIKNTAFSIEDSLDSLREKIRNENFSKPILADIEKIKYQTDKILKISSLITKSGFNLIDDNQVINISDYIYEYIETYSYAFSDKVKIQLIGHSSFTTKLSFFDIAIIIDNLISNSVKSGAKKIQIELSEKDGKEFYMSFSDDGAGLAKKYAENPKAIFELGVTNSKEGSGIGLYTIDSIMREKKYGKIDFIGNGVGLKGANFKLTFK